MIDYGIKIVRTGWNDLDSIQFGEKQFELWKSDLDSGTRMLLFEPEATNAIVAEVEITADYDRGTIVPEQVTVPSGMTQTGQSGVPTPTGAVATSAVVDTTEGEAPTSGVYTIPVKHLHKRTDIKQIPLQRVREITGIHDFPRVDEVFLPLEKETYESLVDEWR